MADVMTFDEILEDPTYKSEFDRRITRALATVQRKLDAEVEKNEQLLKTSKTAEGETVESLKAKVEQLEKQISENAETHKNEVETLQAQLADRDYTDAISKAIAGANEGKGLHFSSKSARAAFESALREKKLELKDGALTDFDKFVEEQKKADPDAFASDKPAARFAGPVGVGGKPAEQESVGAMYAKQFNAQYAQTPKKE